VIERPDTPDKTFPIPVSVRVGERWLDAFVHGTRIGRRGRQVLISDVAERVRTRTERSADTART
jgi:hypothetical protein